MVQETMRAARLYAPAEPMRIDVIPRPKFSSRDVLVKVEACGVIPNMTAIFSGRLWNLLPPLPAIMGLDAAGVIAEVGTEVDNFAVGDRVYINPWLTCGSCSYCRNNMSILCAAAAFQGYFGFFPESMKLLEKYPYGGFCEYTTASLDRLVKLPANVSFDHAARFGYLGTSYSGLKFGGVGSGSWVLINGITGTLGVGATLLALGMGATRILGFGRNREILKQLKALAPNRIDTLAIGDALIDEWVRERTEGLGADVLLDCSARTSDVSLAVASLAAIKRGGKCINVGALAPMQIEPMKFMNHRYEFRGSNWFTTGEAQQMAEMASVGVLDLSQMVNKTYPLERINDALEAVKSRPGGFTNIVVRPGE